MECNQIDNFKTYITKKMTKILVVGCGGLGCELLKIISSFPNNRIFVIDNDQIDQNNLNRQFFYTKADINKYKAKVLGEKCNCEFICNKIQNVDSYEFYKKFDIVFNCVDNNDTRSHVNQMCYLTKTRLIDGGSAGWLGQSFSADNECFDCLPKKQEKLFPICTVRYKPENFEHCLAWAKLAFENRDMKVIEEERRSYFAEEKKSKDKSYEINSYEKSFFKKIINKIFDSESTTCSDSEIEEKEVNKKEVNKKEVNKKEVNKKEVNKKEVNKKEVNKKEVNKKEVNKKEVNKKENKSNGSDNNENKNIIKIGFNPNNTKIQQITNISGEEMKKLKKSKPISISSQLTKNIFNKKEKVDSSNEGIEFEMVEDKRKEEYIALEEITNDKLIDFSKTQEINFCEIKNSNIFIYSLALFRAKRFGIEPYDYLKATTYVNKIIPSICTTNSIIACLMIFSSQNYLNYYLQGEIVPVGLKEKNPECLTCGIPNYICKFTPKARFSDIKKTWPDVTEIITDKTVFKENFDVFLTDYTHKFCIVIRKGMKYRLYFETTKAKRYGRIDLERVR
ncbi:uba2 [Nucleospora cyclopteri]